MKGRFSGARALLTVALACAACVGPAVANAQEFLAYEGKNAVQEGDGGAKKVVDGIEFWSDGAPPRRFQLLGYISDRRHKTGLIGMISMSGLESSIATVAKQHGGDAVILMQSDTETLGTIRSANVTANTTAYGTANATANATTNGTAMTVNASGFSTERKVVNESGFSVERKVQKQNSRFALVKYVSDTPDTSVVPAASAPTAAVPAADMSAH